MAIEPPEAMNTVCRDGSPASEGGNGQAFKGATRFSSGSCTRPRKRECFMYR